jgi:CRISPR-associated endonuclease/helicase Cas3
MRISDGRVARPAQEAIGHLPLPASASTLLLEDETGAGKTEAALWWFARLFAAGLVDGLYFALPTRTAATQIQRRVTDVIKRLWPNEPRPPVVLAVPGYIRVDEETGQRPLTGFGVLWNDRQRHPERWAAEHPKRYLAGTVVVGTIDQVLLAALKTSHSHLRATCLLRHLLVVDEVHASDAYMTTILEQVLAHHRAAGGHALLMSATLGSTVRARLLATEPEWDLANACTRPYPLISRDDGQPSVPVRPWSASRAITLDPVALIDDAQAIAAAAIQAAHNGARVLIIRNTVSGCLAVFNAIARAEPELLWRCNGTPAPHHARFAREDREALDQHLESSFGGASPSRGMIACATQTVQQALDIDADFLVSDLCPADVLLQRLGRLHRHRSRQRPAGFSAPRALILVPTRPLVDLITANGQPRGKHGLGAVYPDLRMLDATWQLVAVRSVTIPDDNRRWVEAITHPEALRPYASLDERWKKHEPLALGSDQARRQIAATNCCDWSASFGGDATGKQHELFREDDLDQTIRTRLGTSDRLVDLPPGTTGPFGITIRRLTLPGWWLEQRQVPHDAPISVEVLGDHLAIHYGDHVFRYDAQGLRPIEATDEDAKADA